MTQRIVESTKIGCWLRSQLLRSSLLTNKLRTTILHYSFSHTSLGTFPNTTIARLHTTGGHSIALRYSTIVRRCSSAKTLSSCSSYCESSVELVALLFKQLQIVFWLWLDFSKIWHLASQRLVILQRYCEIYLKASTCFLDTLCFVMDIYHLVRVHIDWPSRHQSWDCWMVYLVLCRVGSVLSTLYVLSPTLTNWCLKLYVFVASLLFLCKEETCGEGFARYWSFGLQKLLSGRDMVFLQADCIYEHNLFPFLSMNG